MKLKNLWGLTLILIVGTAAFVQCQNPQADLQPLSGTMDEPLPADAAPAHVLEAINAANRLHQHEIMSDTVCDIAVMSLDEADSISTEGYGIVVVNGAVSTTFPNIRNTRQPGARYDSTHGDLWLTSSTVEGTGVQVEWLYRIRFHDDGTAFLASTVNPYDIQQTVLQRMGYIIRGEEVTFYDGSQIIATATNTVTDMGGFDQEQPIWIGEQIRYDLGADGIRVAITPGVKFTTGLVLTYDDMPTLTFAVTLDSEGNIILKNQHLSNAG